MHGELREEEFLKGRKIRQIFVFVRGFAAFSARSGTLGGKIWRLKNLGPETGGKWRLKIAFGSSVVALQLWGKAPVCVHPFATRP